MLFDVSSRLCEFFVFVFFGDWSLPFQDWLLPQEAKCVFHFCICISFMSLCLYLHLLEAAGLCPPKIGFSRKRQKGPKKLRADPFTRKKLQRLDPFIRQIVFNGNCIGSAGSEYKSDQGLNIHYIHLYSSHFHLYSRLLRFTLKKCQ